MPPPNRLQTTDKVLAVFNDRRQAKNAMRELSKAGFGADDVELLASRASSELIDASGLRGGLWRRVKRLIDFSQADQSVDLAVYEAALRQGRAVVAVHVPDRDDRDRAVAVLEAEGGHFINYFGVMTTQQILPWRGEDYPVS
jgi:hypothetical protein